MLITNTVLARAKNHRKNESGNGDKLGYGLCSYQGLRYEMEDAHCAYPVIQCLRGWSFFGIFDGHGGTLCSTRVSDHLVDHIFKQIFARAGIDTSNYMLLREFKLNSAETQKLNNLDPNVIAKAIEQAFLTMDKYLSELDEIKREDDKSGTTVICALITNSHVYLINCGDSRGMLVKSGRVEISTYDHKPTNRKERQRIQDAGGMVALHRVNGGLATSRGLGDFEYKCVPGLSPDKQYVSPIPDVSISDREQGDEFIVLACDGIWDVMSNEDVLMYVRERIMSEPLDRLSENLLDNCLDRVRGEVSRLIFAAARQKYEDHRIDLMEWFNWSQEQKNKIGAPFGQLPILEVRENSQTHVIAQSHTIERFLAARFNLAGDNDIERAKIEMIVDGLGDFYEKLFEANFVERDEEKKKELKDKVWKLVPKRLQQIEKMLANSKSGYAVGSRLSYADLALLNASLDWYGQRKEGLLANLPHLRAHERKILNEPAVADWINNRPKSKL